MHFSIISGSFSPVFSIPHEKKKITLEFPDISFQLKKQKGFVTILIVFFCCFCVEMSGNSEFALEKAPYMENTAYNTKKGLVKSENKSQRNQ